MNVVDWAGVALLGVSVLAGAFRGLIAQVLSLIGWVVAYFASQWLAPQLAPHLPLGSLSPGATMAVAMGLGFIAVLLGWGLLSMAVVSAVRATGMSGPDRLLGAGFGFFRGLFIAAVVVTLVQMTPLAASAPWQQSSVVAGVRTVVRGLRPLLPAEVAHYAQDGS